MDEQDHQLRLKTVRPLYRQFHPSRDLETLRGVGQDSAALYIAFIGDIQRFPSLRDFLNWSGLIPFSHQSGDAQARSLRVTKAGPNLVKATAFLNASIARQWDPQIAAVYYRQIMQHGKHHLQATCACATHLLTRIYADYMTIVHTNYKTLTALLSTGTPIVVSVRYATACQMKYVNATTAACERHARKHASRSVENGNVTGSPTA
mgnify:CR=1 FL=1